MRGSSFVGRCAELEVLRAQWTTACAGAPQLALIEGAGGTGKTSLARRFLSDLDQSSVLWVTGDEGELTLSFGLLDQVFARLGQLQPVPGGLRPGIDDHRELGDRDPHLEGAALLRALGDAQTRGPMILVVDDVNLADAASLAALTFALRRLRTGRVLVVVTARSETLADLPPGLRRLVESDGVPLQLDGLSVPEVQALARLGGFGHLSQRAAERLRQHTDGFPLHLRALMKDLTLVQAERLDVPLPAPRSLSMLVLAGLGVTSGSAQDLAAAAAVLGSRPPLRLAARLAGLASGLAAMEELQRARIADLVATECDTRIAFVHPLVRAAVYDDLRAAHRADLHHRATELTEGAESLRHRVCAVGATPDPELVPALVTHADRLAADGHLSPAAGALLDAFRLCEPGHDRDELLLDALDLLLSAGDLARARSYADALAELPEDAHRSQVQARMAWLGGRHQEADALARAAWGLRDERDHPARDEAAAMVAQMCLMRGDGDGAAAWATKALASGLLTGEMAAATRGCAAIGLALSGRVDDGMSLLSSLPSRAAVTGDRPDLGARGMLRLWTDDLEEAKRDLRSGLPPDGTATGTSSGGGSYRLVFHLYLAEAEYRSGSWDAARALAEEGVFLVEDLGQVWLRAFAHAVAALVPSGRGQWELAADHVEAAQRAAAELGDQPSRAYADNACVHLAACRGDGAGVVDAATWLLGTAGAHHEPGFFTWPVEHLAALAQQGHLTEAEARLAQLEGIAESSGRRSLLASLTRVRAELAAVGRDTTGARRLFDEALALQAGGSDALEAATLQLSVGRFLRRRGERRAAQTRLTAARDRFEALGARPFVVRCEQELAASGSAARRSPPSLLTPQERAVAQLVCAGRTNREVAEELAISVKTVAYHLGHVYSKVGVSSRTALSVRLRT